MERLRQLGLLSKKVVLFFRIGCQIKEVLAIVTDEENIFPISLTNRVLADPAPEEVHLPRFTSVGSTALNTYQRLAFSLLTFD
jgi:hypothetical protein